LLLARPSVTVRTAFENKVDGGTFDGLLVCSLNREISFVQALNNSRKEEYIKRYFFIANKI
jgi:hypothetical protein